MEDLGAITDTITDTAAEVLPPVNQTATRRVQMAKSVWTAERTELLKSLFAGGELSCRMMAIELGEAITRNAVIGKINRMGLRGPEKREPTVCKPARTSAGRTRKNRTTEPGKPLTLFWRAHDKPPLIPEAEEPAAVDFIPPNPVTFAQLEDHHCRFPVGDSPFMFCGETPKQDRPYCTAHCRLAYVPSAPRKPWVPGRVEG